MPYVEQKVWFDKFVIPFVGDIRFTITLFQMLTHLKYMYVKILKSNQGVYFHIWPKHVLTPCIYHKEKIAFYIKIFLQNIQCKIFLRRKDIFHIFLLYKQ